MGSARADETVSSCGTFANEIFQHADEVGAEEDQTCGQTGGHFDIAATSSSPDGTRSLWETSAPAGLEIDEASVDSMTPLNINNPGDAWGGGFFWGPDSTDGDQAIPGEGAYGPVGIAQGSPGFPSSDFGFQLVCGTTSGCPGNQGSLTVGEVDLSVGETQSPTLTAGGLWAQTGWVRGSWPITANGDSASGVCSLSASLQGDPAAVTQTFSPDPSAWHQCNAIGEGGLSGTINTTLAPSGADTLSVSDADAAGLTAGASKTLDVDNETPTIVLTGPASALSTAGTQDVTVSVNAGPSGAYGADCSVDGGASTFYAGATVQVPVSGIGQHTVTCVGLNNAVDSSGTRASSSPESFSMDIQQPSQEAITFSKKTGGLTCHTVVKKVQKLGKRRTVTLKGHKVQVRRVRYVKHKVRKCHAATVRRKVLVELKHDGKVVRRHGKIVRVKRVRQVVLLPHRVHKTVRHVKHGAETTVSGYLLSDGTPLADQTVAVLAAPNGADPQFSAISSAVTNANGFWVAKVPAGPSRLLQAQFAGSATTAAADSTLVRLKVPAKIRILSHTKRTAWGQTVDFTGRLYGGHIPRSGVNIRLRYGYDSHSITYGVKTHVGPDGRFRTKFTFGPGAPNDRYRFHFQFSTLPGGNYPWAVARSNKAFVAVGGHPHRHA